MIGHLLANDCRFRNFTLSFWVKSNWPTIRRDRERKRERDKEKALDPMEGVLTETSDLNVVLETITSQKSHSSLKPVEKETTAKDTTKKAVEVPKPIDNNVYKDYNNQTREVFIDRMIEGPLERGKITLSVKDLGIYPRNAMRWWKHYQETGVAYKKSQKNPGQPNSFTP
ncbi:hypothetical protein EDC94DRAFT_613609 [Helicostylum pulchrum]|nr:hypothetical protein EDC94DRAFT_613609 [Helicostylum pulchrum]